MNICYYIIDSRNLLTKSLQQTVLNKINNTVAFSLSLVAFRNGSGGIRTHDDADMKRTLSEHGYGRSVGK